MPVETIWVVRRQVEILEKFQALVLGIYVNGARDVTALVLVRVPAVDNFECGDAIFETALH